MGTSAVRHDRRGESERGEERGRKGGKREREKERMGREKGWKEREGEGKGSRVSISLKTTDRHFKKPGSTRCWYRSR